MNARLATFLSAHHLTSGIGGYWESSVVTVGSDGAVTIRAVQHVPACEPYLWEAKSSWYDPGPNRANFLVTSNGPGFFNHWRPKPGRAGGAGPSGQDVSTPATTPCTSTTRTCWLELPHQ